MRRTLLLLSCFLLSLSALLIQSFNVEGQRGANFPVILISIDGLKPDYVLEAGKYNLKIPNLRRFVKEGAYATNVTGVEPTVTYPSHTTMITGVSPAKHGIYNNTPFDPFSKNLGGWYWYTEDVKVQTLWEAVNKAGGVTASVDWPASVGAPVKYNIAQIWRARTEHDRKLIRAVSTPGLLTEAESKLGRYHDGDDYSIEADGLRANFNVYLLETKKPRFQTVYFGGLDHEEHDHGPYSPQAYAGLEKIDGFVGKVRAAAEKIGGGRAIVCVVSDHGFSPTKKELRLNAALREAGLIEVDGAGRVKSWRAFAWNSGGSAAVMLNDRNDREARDKVREILQRIAGNPENGLLKFYEGEEARKLGGFPDAAFIVGTKSGFYLGGGLDAPILRDIKPGGGHGFLPELAEMDSSFFIAGPGIPAGRNLGRIDMRDIAPTLASLLGVELPSAEGRDALKRK
jgi:predicted AlkP superfamily pyrophosphatase or phosphodiesterase